jgi:hypothetical protein
VSVTSTQPGYEVYIDNQRNGLTPFVCAIAPGQYALRLERNGVVVVSEQIEVSDGNQFDRTIN